MLEATPWNNMLCLLGHVEQAIGCAFTCIVCVNGITHLLGQEQPFPTELCVILCSMKLGWPCH